VQYFFLEQKLRFFIALFPGKGKEKGNFLLLSTMKTFIDVAPCWLQHKLYDFQMPKFSKKCFS
jgi:hypothetical protein